MKNVKTIITNLIQEALGDELLRYIATPDDIVLEHPADMTHGDYSCNIAMRLSKQLGKNPREIAEGIIANIADDAALKKVEVAGPGFINFYLSDTFFEEGVAEVIEKKDNFGKVDLLKGKRVLLEHSSPNLFKPFHIGHLVNNAIGESIGRILAFSGAEVEQISYPSDVSPGIAKTVWALLENKQINNLTIDQIGAAYVQGVAAYKEDVEVKKVIDGINKDLYHKKETEVYEVFKQGRAISKEYFERMTKRLGSDFSQLIFESEADVRGREIVHAHTPKVFTESQGAIIFEGSKHGLFDNVFINSAGFATYLGKDIGLFDIKYKTFDFDISLTVTDIEQKQHFQLAKKAASLIKKEWAEKSTFLQHGRLQFLGGKVSARYGNVPLIEDLLEEIKGPLLNSSERNLDPKTAEQIAIAALKYMITRVSAGKNISFDQEKATSIEGDSGPYLQYTYARCQSILAKSDNVARGPLATLQMPKDWAVTNIEKLLYRFPEVVERAAIEYEPHYIANYLNDLASTFNSWYGQGKILDGSDAEQYKLVLTEATAYAIKNGLYLLGIDAPEKM